MVFPWFFMAHVVSKGLHSCAEANVDEAARQRISFQTGDACRRGSLPSLLGRRLKDRVEDLGQFDGAVLAP